MTKWTHVNDKLPNQGVRVLTSNLDGYILILQYDSYYESWTDEDYNVNQDYWLKNRPFWMPLPKALTP